MINVLLCSSQDKVFFAVVIILGFRRRGSSSSCVVNGNISKNSKECFFYGMKLVVTYISFNTPNKIPEPILNWSCWQEPKYDSLFLYATEIHFEQDGNKNTPKCCTGETLFWKKQNKKHPTAVHLNLISHILACCKYSHPHNCMLIHRWKYSPNP